MLVPALLLVLTPALPGDRDPAPGVKPLTVDDAIAKIYVEPGRIVSLGDLDGDGGPEIALASVDGNDFVIQAWSARVGKLVRTMWRGWVPGVSSSDLVWDAGGDVDGDGFPDVIVGSPRDAHGGGSVFVVSGASQAQLHRFTAPKGLRYFGCSVGFAGDTDGDGFDDIVVGSRNVQPNVDYGYGELYGELNLPEESAEDQFELQPGRVAMFSGQSGKMLWSVQRGAPGEGFGSRVHALGDLDHDGSMDWIVESDPYQSQSQVALLSGASGAELGAIPGLGRAASAGDFDGDGVPDLCFGVKDVRPRGTHLVSGATLKQICVLSQLDPLSGDADLAQSLGDLDGDGFDDLALGARSFRFPSRQHNQPLTAVAPSTVAETLQRSATSGSTTGMPSGCVVVFSGRTRVPIWGCFGRPNQGDSLGLATAAIPDVSGDGSPDIVIGGSCKAYVLPGPGKSAK